jgi:5-methyltetrahydropteroyltriglutamate--homocysteine methyltransferase
MSKVMIGNLGYPRIGENREWKKLLEQFWSGEMKEEAFVAEMKAIRLHHLRKQQEKGVGIIPVGDFTFYDHMLDMSTMFGIVPKRYTYDGGLVSLQTYFSMARGSKESTACEMTKWFNTNYHYIVPEWNGTKPHVTVNRPLEAYREAKEELGIVGKPVIIGPYTFLKLSKGYAVDQFAALLGQLVPLYAQILHELQEEGVDWVQLDEPGLVQSVSEEEMQLFLSAYRQLAAAAPKLKLLLQTYFDSVDGFEQLIQLPVSAIGLDFVHGKEGNLASLQTYGFPKDKYLGIGLIDGRNIWRADVAEKLELVNAIAQHVPFARMILQPSSSLLHVPVNLQKETNLDPFLRNALAFADEKLDELVLLSKAVNQGEDAVSHSLTMHQEAISALNQSLIRTQDEDRSKLLQDQPKKRQTSFEDRYIIQQKKWALPSLPTTTIGSFPQTAEVRKARQLWRKGEWSKEQYVQFIQKQIHQWIDIQEQVGLDVLVHGEFERTDMVEFFGEKLAGFAFTVNGWVQSYGSRCVKPPIIYGNVSFAAPMTVEETVFAQSLTNKPVKGMLTGPITILNWSFVRDDIPRRDVAYQIALALRQEVEALEAAGIEMIQVDEPALREGLPLKPRQWNDYLSWAVEAFRITTATVKDTTQIHTHMCYCEFHDMIESIKALDADVISIETSRSHGELIASFEANTYDKGIGLGVYDIHSPRVPLVDEMLKLIERALRVLPNQLFWINPDCGLKTRGMEETVTALRNMVMAAHEIRSRMS